MFKKDKLIVKMMVMRGPELIPEQGIHERGLTFLKVKNEVNMIFVAMALDVSPDVRGSSVA